MELPPNHSYVASQMKFVHIYACMKPTHVIVMKDAAVMKSKTKQLMQETIDDHVIAKPEGLWQSPGTTHRIAL